MIQKSLTKTKQDKRIFIIETAAKVFAKYGFHKTLMQDISNEAQIGKGTIYEYFTTKEELFFSIYDHWMNDLESIAQKRFDDAPDQIAKTEALRDTMIEFYESRANEAPLILEFWAHSLRTDEQLFLNRIRKVRRFFTNLGNSITNDLTKYGYFIPVEEESFTELESGISDGIFLLWLLNGQNFSLKKAFQFRQSVIGLGLLADDARTVVKSKLEGILSEGFLPTKEE